MEIEKYKALAAMVRSFFEAFSAGVIDSQRHGDTHTPTPQTVKKLMLEHYGHIAPVFLDTIFFPIAAMNFDYAGIERVVREAQQRGDGMMALVRTACADDAMYGAMVAEYKRNFSNLLAGRYATNADHLAAYTRPAAPGTAIAAERAVELTARVVMFAYARGLRQVCADKARMRQTTLFRLMLDAMNVLLNEQAVALTDDDAKDLGSMFVKVCGTESLFTTLTDEMDRTYDELVRREGVE